MYRCLFFVLLFTVTAFANVLAANSSVQTFNCGTTISEEEIESTGLVFHRKMAERAGMRELAAHAATISVYFHVVSEDDTVAGGNVSESQILDQISVLNSDFGETGVSFTLTEIGRTVNINWFTNAGPSSSLQTAMKQSLRQGDATTLNVYTVGFDRAADQGLLGYTTFSSSYSSNPDDYGVVMRFTTLPGGSQTNYNGGQVITHETGHWVGLYHTFRDGCSGSGDMVNDTPAEAEPASGYPEGRDTCSSPGVDPIHNYMDYAYNSCMEEFTPGQITRLTDQIATYRGL
ncbi:hypothetical protein ACEPAI_4549 [Sanghuangporus weigelae]